MLSIKEQYLVDWLLNKEGYVAYEDLASVLNVTVRTIYNYLDRLNDYLDENGLVLDKKRGHGIRLVPKINQGNKSVEERKNSIFYRREVMKLFLLFHFRHKTSINQLCQVFFMTKTSVQNDLVYIEEELDQFQLKLKKDYLGTELIGKRKNIKSAFVNSVHKYGSSIIYDNRDILSGNEMYSLKILVREFRSAVIDGLARTEQKYSYRFDFDFIQSLLIHLMIDYLLFGKENIQREENCWDTPGRYFCEYLENEVGYQFSSNFSKDRIVQYLEFFAAYDQKKVPSIFQDVSHNIRDDFEKVLGVNYLEICNDQEFSYLIFNIARRMEHRVAVFHPLLHEIKQDNGLEFLMLRLLFATQECYQVNIDDDETSFVLIDLLNLKKEIRPKISYELNIEGSSNTQKFIQNRFISSMSFCNFELVSKLQIATKNRIIFEKNCEFEKISLSTLKMDIFNRSHELLLIKEIKDQLKMRTNLLLNERFIIDKIT